MKRSGEKKFIDKQLCESRSHLLELRKESPRDCDKSQSQKARVFQLPRFANEYSRRPYASGNGAVTNYAYVMQRQNINWIYESRGKSAREK